MGHASVRGLLRDVERSAHVKRAASYLQGKRDELAAFPSFDDFIDELVTRPTRELKAVEHHIAVLSTNARRTLARNELFVGPTLLDELLFDYAAHPVSDDGPAADVFRLLVGRRLTGPGLVLYPLHSFGILAAGLLRISPQWAGQQPIVRIPTAGLVVTPQTGSLDATLAFLELAKRDLGIRREIPRGYIEHWHRSRPTKWLVQNPLLAARITSLPGSYYENQPFIVARLKFAIALVLMLSDLQPDPPRGAGRLFSTASINNFETLDIRHYIVLHPAFRGRTRLDGDCVPMNASRWTLAELSSLPVQLDIAAMRRPAMAQRIVGAVLEAQRGYFAHGVFSGDNTATVRIYRKLFDALEFLRRSHRGADGDTEGLANIAAAFEVLLTDHYERGNQEAQIGRRLELALAGESGKRSLMRAWENVYSVRGQYLHSGRVSVSADLRAAWRTFAFAFMSVAERLHRVPNIRSTAERPLGELLGDT